MVNTRVYRAWHGMKTRCTRKEFRNFHLWGGRGITFLPEWKTFSVFYEYLKTLLPEGETDIPKGMSIDRFPNQNGNYEPGNIRIATKIAQARNNRRNRLVEIDGITRCVTEWAEILGIDPRVVFCRIYRGTPEVEALTRPARGTRG